MAIPAPMSKKEKQARIRDMGGVKIIKTRKSKKKRGTDQLSRENISRD